METTVRVKDDLLAGEAKELWSAGTPIPAIARELRITNAEARLLVGVADLSDMVAAYVKETATPPKAIASMYGCSLAELYTAIHEAGAELRPANRAGTGRRVPLPLLDAAMAMYERGDPLRFITEQTTLSSPTITKEARLRGILRQRPHTTNA